MSLVFSSLYELALELLTAPSGSPLYKWTAHHFAEHVDAEGILRLAILKDTMPGESNQTDWGITRIFMFNLINRAQAPMTWEKLHEILEAVQSDCISGKSDDLHALLLERLANNAKLSASLSAYFKPERAPFGASSYSEWLSTLIKQYADTTVDQLDPSKVLKDIRAISKDQLTRIPNMGIPLAANLLADLGIKASVKPDLHVRPTIRGLTGNAKLSDAAIIQSIIVLAQEEAPRLREMHEFAWLNEAGGLYPRHIDRLIYLIGSDNFFLNGRKDRFHAPLRREWILKSIASS